MDKDNRTLREKLINEDYSNNKCLMCKKNERNKATNSILCTFCFKKDKQLKEFNNLKYYYK
jgi:hypothetical protein